MKIIKIGAVWCPGCLIMKKIWKDIRETYPELDILDLDYDIDNGEVAKYNIGKVLPVTIFLDDNNQELERIVGEFKIDKFSVIVDKYR